MTPKDDCDGSIKSQNIQLDDIIAEIIHESLCSQGFITCSENTSFRGNERMTIWQVFCWSLEIQSDDFNGEFALKLATLLNENT